MHGDYIYLDDKIVREYIKRFGKKLLGKDYELGAGLMMKVFFEIENKCECLLGIKIQTKYITYYQNRASGPFNIEEARILIEEHKDEDDPFDLSVSPLLSFRGNKNSAWRLQMKRFGHFQEDKTTSGLIDALSEIKTKYATTEGFLVFLFDGHKGISLKTAHEYLKNHGSPFSRILFINPTKKNDESWVIQIGEIWPGHGHNEYDPTLFKAST